MTQLTTPSLSSDSSRKRLRSASRSSTASGASSPKRAASDSPAPTSSGKHEPPPGLSQSTDAEVDEYMQSQGENLSLRDGIIPGGVDQSTTISPAPAAPPSPEAKLERVKALRQRKLKLGDTWYIVHRTWYRNWESACGGTHVKGAPEDESLIPPIDNSALAGSRPGRLKAQILEEGVNIELLPDDAWELLVEWYGQPSHTFARKVIAEGLNRILRVEFYPMTFLVYRVAKENPPPPQSYVFSKTHTLLDVREQAINPLIPTNKPHMVWRIDGGREFEIDGIEDETKGFTPHDVTIRKPTLVNLRNNGLGSMDTLEDLFYNDGDKFVVEVKDKADDPWLIKPALSPKPRGNRDEGSDSPIFAAGDFFAGIEASNNRASTSTAMSSTAKSYTFYNGGFSMSSLRNQRNLTPKTRGTIGLMNLGNTCFMNSALQCLAHLPEMTDYFLTGLYAKELNPKNPLSTGGELAKSYGSLLQQLFDAASNQWSIAPRDLKLKISRHAPSFSGYAQHDTQELLAFLLDGLHEDLNRIIKKPYVENPDWNGGDDIELVKLAKTFWSGYKKRNDSMIVDLFQGQYKSTLVCPECAKVSITFDPFMYLTLPLPYDKSWEHDIYYVTWENDRPNYKTRVHLSRNSTFRELKVLLAKWFDSNPDNLLSAEIFTGRIYKFFPDYHGVSDVMDNDTIFIYELPVHSGQSNTPYQPQPDDPIILPVYTVSPSIYRSYAPSASAYRYGGAVKSKETWGYPFFVGLRPEDAISEERIYETIMERYAQTTKLADDLYEWMEAEESDESEESDGVMVTAPQSETSSPNGDPFVDAKIEDEEDLQEVKVEPPSPPREKPVVETEQEKQLMRGPAKKEVFMMTVMEGNFDASAHNNHGASYDLGRVANMQMRLDTYNRLAEEGDTDHPQRGLFRPHDAMVCEWESRTQLHFFGQRAQGPQSRWSETEIHIDEEQAAKAAAKNAKQKAGISIEDCLNEFVKEEELGEDDPWYCPQCKKHQQATKKFDIWKVPDILVVHLKRFSNSRILRDKIDALVDFPIEGLDLTARVEENVVAKRLAAAGISLEELGLTDKDEPVLYDLFAVDEHMGGLGGGHYRAYAKNQEDDKWYHYDDARVDATSPQSSVTPYAYLLFYRRRTTEPIGGETAVKLEKAKLSPPTPPPPEEPTASSSSGMPNFRMLPNTPPSRRLALSDITPDTSPRSMSPMFGPLPQSPNRFDAINLRRGGSPMFDNHGYANDDLYQDWGGDESEIVPLDVISTPSPQLSPTLSDDDSDNQRFRRLPVHNAAPRGNDVSVDEDYDDQADGSVKEIYVDEATETDVATSKDHSGKDD